MKSEALRFGVVAAMAWMLGATAVFPQSEPPAPHRLGLLPVQDRTGEVFREAYGQNLRRLLVAELLELGEQPFFLNTGPGFGEADGELTEELARQAKVDALLRTRLVAVTDGATWKRLENSLNAATPESRQTAVSILSRPAHRDEIRRLVDGGGALLVVEVELAPIDNPEERRRHYVAGRIRNVSWKDLLDLDSTGGGSLKQFKDTGPGRAARESAEKIAKLVGVWLASGAIRATGERPPASGVCRVTFGVRYLKLNRTSRNFTVAINGQEVTYAIRNGRVTLDVPSGQFTVRVTVQDAPYGMPVQKGYDANDFIACSGDSRTAFLEIGAIGEAVLTWGSGQP